MKEAETQAREFLKEEGEGEEEIEEEIGIIKVKDTSSKSWRGVLGILGLCKNSLD